METSAKGMVAGGAKGQTRRPAPAEEPDAPRRRYTTGTGSVTVLRRAAGEAVSFGLDGAPAAGRASLDALQRLAGNRAVCGLLSVGQAKLQVGAAGDRYEQEADNLAHRVVTALRKGTSGPEAPAHEDDETIGRAPALSASASRAGDVGRATSNVKEPEVGLAGGSLEPATEAAVSSARRGGAHLAGEVRTAMESAFGADFGQVKVHSGPASMELNDRVQAKAFTIGNDIFFRDGVPDARTSQGQELLAHELTHTIQQGAAKTLPGP